MQNSSFIFAPGLYSSVSQIAKYCKSFIAPNKEIIVCENGSNVINQDTTVVEFSETEAYNGFTLNPLKWFHYAFYMLKTLYRGIKIENMQYPSNYTYDIKYSNINFGQNLDMCSLQDAYDKHIQTFDMDIVLFGISRGAGTIFNWLTINEEHLNGKVKGVVLEGIFDSMENVLTDQWWYNRVTKWLLKKCTSYDANGISPLKFVSSYPKDIPTLMITSEMDDVVPFILTMNLHNELVLSGHKNVELVVLKHSTHSEYIIGKDKEAYVNALNAFYTKI